MNSVLYDVIQIGDYELSLEREGDLGLKSGVDDTAATLEGEPGRKARLPSFSGVAVPSLHG